jgi:hypothetical protein
LQTERTGKACLQTSILGSFSPWSLGSISLSKGPF